MNTTLKKKN